MAERSHTPPANDFPVTLLGKSLFLILEGITPTRTAVEQGRLVCYFDRIEAGPYARVFQRLMEDMLIPSREGVNLSPEMIMERSEFHWNEMEDKAARKVAQS